jgi:hypothetical protein
VSPPALVAVVVITSPGARSISGTNSENPAVQLPLAQAMLAPPAMGQYGSLAIDSAIVPRMREKEVHPKLRSGTN